MTVNPAPVGLRARMIQAQHLAGNHKDCLGTDCPWWRLPEWVRKAERHDLPAKELVTIQ